MPPELIPDDDYYASSEDSDFAPDNAPAQASEESSDGESEVDETATKKGKLRPAKRKRGQNDEAEDLGIENSGDEAIIERALKKQRKKKGKEKEKNEDEGGEGGLVKTRSMRASEYVYTEVWKKSANVISRKVEKKPLADTSTATVDVDALWADMISGESKARDHEQTRSAKDSIEIDSRSLLSPKATLDGFSRSNVRKESISPSTLGDGPDSMIMIKRTYNFAGKVHVEQKLVPRSSAEAKLYLASQQIAPHPPIGESLSPFMKGKRPTKKAQRSVFEPISDMPIRTDLRFGIRLDSGMAITDIGKDAKKLNTVEKSAMDWAGFVDKEGIKDELDAAGKSKGAYKSRQEFLARVEQKKEEESRRARGLHL
jgi:hypothetical protein